MGCSISSVGGGMNLLAEISMGAQYTGNEAWVPQLGKYNLIYLEADFGSIGSAAMKTTPTAIYSPSAFKKMLDYGKTTSADYVFFVTAISGGQTGTNLTGYRGVRMNYGYWGVNNGDANITKLKIYGIK